MNVSVFMLNGSSAGQHVGEGLLLVSIAVPGDEVQIPWPLQFGGRQEAQRTRRGSSIRDWDTPLMVVQASPRERVLPAPAAAVTSGNTAMPGFV